MAPKPKLPTPSVSFKDYEDKQIIARHKERVAAALIDLGYDPKDTIQLSNTEHSAVLQSIQEQMRRDYCIQVACRVNNVKVLRELLEP